MAALIFHLKLNSHFFHYSEFPCYKETNWSTYQIPEEKTVEECYIAVKMNELQMHSKVHKLVLCNVKWKKKKDPDDSLHYDNFSKYRNKQS